MRLRKVAQSICPGTFQSHDKADQACTLVTTTGLTFPIQERTLCGSSKALSLPVSMQRNPAGILRSIFDSQYGPRDRFIPRWLFLRALAAIYFSAFYSLLFQIRGLIGPRGILPAQEYLADLASFIGWQRYWYAPSLF